MSLWYLCWILLLQCQHMQQCLANICLTILSFLSHQLADDTQKQHIWAREKAAGLLNSTSSKFPTWCSWSVALAMLSHPGNALLLSKRSDLVSGRWRNIVLLASCLRLVPSKLHLSPWRLGIPKWSTVLVLCEPRYPVLCWPKYPVLCMLPRYSCITSKDKDKCKTCSRVKPNAGAAGAGNRNDVSFHGDAGALAQQMRVRGVASVYD